MHEKIQHLNENEIENVIAMYENETIKIKDIIEKFSIDVQPSQLVRILPPSKTDDICIICGEPLFAKRKARSQSEYGHKQQDKFCLKCNHYEYAKIGGKQEKCNCEGCIQKEKEIEEQKRETLRKVYAPKTKINFNDLELEDQISLLFILFTNRNRNISVVAPMEEDDIISPKIDRLLEIGAISVSPDSSLDAFNKEKFPYIYLRNRVMYNVNVVFDEGILELINRNEYFLTHAHRENLIQLFKKYIYEDLVAKYDDLLTERKLNLYISEPANTRFNNLVDKISYSQILRLCYKSAVFLSDRVVRDTMSREKANNTALMNVCRFYENAEIGNWSLYHAKIEHLNPELFFFIKKVLNEDESILTKVPNVDIFR